MAPLGCSWLGLGFEQVFTVVRESGGVSLRHGAKLLVATREFVALSTHPVAGAVYEKNLVLVRVAAV